MNIRKISILFLTLIIAGSLMFTGCLAPIQQEVSSLISVNYTESNNATETPSSIADVVEDIKDSVVEISTEIETANWLGAPTLTTSAGSGVIFAKGKSDGASVYDLLLIITNNHVIEDATSINVVLTDGKSRTAYLWATDAEGDLALIYINIGTIDTDVFKPVTFANVNYNLRVGDIAIVIGNPLGSLGGSVSSGIISSLERTVTVESKVMTLLQTDASVNPGNSGGGMFNIRGELIGIVNAKVADSSVEGIGFAIPLSTIMNIIPQLLNNKIVARPAIGISAVPIFSSTDANGFLNNFNIGTMEYSYWYNLLWNHSTLNRGIYVYEVTNEASGLLKGDKILKVGVADESNNFTILTELTDSSSLSTFLRVTNIGDRIVLQISRKNSSTGVFDTQNIFTTLIQKAA